MKLAIIGSRSINQINLDDYIKEKPALVISGGAKGIDTVAWAWAVDNHIEILVIRPEYNKYGKVAPLKRNEIIVNESDKVLAFWDGKSRGTKYVIDYANKKGKEIEVIILKNY
jgi:predicted Rossmann fold nucleotide-binding protein DprA/Smf involved in DNA uptake